MKRLFLFLFIVGLTYTVAAKVTPNMEIDSLLRELDIKLNTYPVVDAKKEAYIRKLKYRIARTVDVKSRFDQYGSLFDLYKNYQVDSAVSVSLKRKREALNLNNKKDIAIANLNYVEVMMMTGMHKNVLDSLHYQEMKFIDKEMKPYVFHLYHSFYLLMKEFSLADSDKHHFSKMVMNYKDSILSILPKDNFGYYLVKSTQLVEYGRFEESLSWALKAYHHFAFKHAKGLSAYTVAACYECLGNQEMEKKYLIISAIDDIENGVKEYISLRKLAFLLYKEGDIDRAYRYTKRAMEDAIFCNARFRTYELSQMLPIINEAYDVKNKHEKQSLRIAIIVISALTLLVILSFIFTYNQLLVLSKTRRSLKDINQELQTINTDLIAVNSRLSESNRVKEEYIGYVFTICSEYIDKMEDLRKKVNRKVKAGQIDELQKMTASTTFVADELKGFYRSFDSVFLNLYPNFVEEFNSLLLPEEQILPKTNDLLTPELRIFALVRLGINDSIKIAEFLHYSPQTIYNYRLKIRAKAKSEKDDFTYQVSRIGQIRK